MCQAQQTGPPEQQSRTEVCVCVFVNVRGLGCVRLDEASEWISQDNK
jgi:hypothetical protein